MDASKMTKYLSGFGNHHQTEALEGSLPTNQNSPQKCPKGLYAEQISGSAFTRARKDTLFSWLYRIQPSVTQQNFELYHKSLQQEANPTQPPVPMRWSAYSILEKQHDFIDGLNPVASNTTQSTFIYTANQSMNNKYFSNYDGELLFVPYMGDVTLHTEFGQLELKPEWIAVIPRGVKFRVELHDEACAGYLCENRASPLKLPELGPIGANGLASPRHFLYPHAAYEEQKQNVEIICKYLDQLYITQSQHSPLNVVAWHGNYAPYCYDLKLFNTINTVSFDHPDPSIFTVLTSESTESGIANLDFVIFPERWMVAKHTFRPPYFHRNIMNEMMGLIKGVYDAKQKGFEKGGFSIHNCMTAHGPDTQAFKTASNQELRPKYYDNTLAFMFESNQPWIVSQQAYNHTARQRDYLSCWVNMPNQFIKV